MSEETGERQPIRGKVARILNTRELAINVGSKHGVTVGMKFDVLDLKGADILDPDTGEVLGSVDRPKVRVAVEVVRENLAIAATFRTRRVNVGGSLDIGISGILMPARWVSKYETLKTNEKTVHDLDEEESYVKTGDPVVEVTREDPDA